MLLIFIIYKITPKNCHSIAQGSTEDSVLTLLIAAVLLALAGLYLKGIYDVSSTA